MNLLFITGMLRSGTTFLEKLIHNHPNISIASQPFFPLYIFFKKKYHQKKGIDTFTPLHDYFLSGEDALEDFYSYIQSYELHNGDIIKLKEDLFLNNDIKEDTKLKMHIKKVSFNSNYFIDIFKSLNDLVPLVYPKENLLYYGSKEVLCEEFMPFLLQNKGIKGIIIIRDPRNVIASLNHGKYKEYVGEIRPLLFNIRNWRKSAAFAMHLESNYNFKLINYEKLVVDMSVELKKICEFLEIDNFNEILFSDGLISQDGKLWVGNSSFMDVNKTNNEHNHFRKVLPDKVINYIETCCFPEMCYFDYKLTTEVFNNVYLSTFIEPYIINRPEFSQDYSSCKEKVAEEVSRFRYLKKDLNMDQAKKWFLFEDVYKKLKESI